MLATAFLSAFISNTATTAMMLPIGLSVISLVLYNGASHEEGHEGHAFATCIMLSIAYAASIGGISTVIGTIPNSFVVAFVRDSIDAPYQQDISFFEWSKIGVPVVLVLLPLSWWLLTKVIYKVDQIKLSGSAASLREKNNALGAMDYEEKAVLGVFAFTVLMWLSRTSLQQLEITLFGTEVIPLAGLTDSGIAIFGAVLLFILPARNHTGQFIPAMGGPQEPALGDPGIAWRRTEPCQRRQGQRGDRVHRGTGHGPVLFARISSFFWPSSAGSCF